MKPHSRSQNSASSSRLCRSYKSCANDSKDSSTNKSVTISNYFTSATNTEMSAESSSIMDERNLQCEESPYKTCLTEIKSCSNTSINDEQDFKTPKEKFKMFYNKQQNGSKGAKCQSKAVRKKQRKPKVNVKSQQLIFTKTVTENHQGADFKLEDIQMAIALSKSMQSHDKQNDNETTTAEYPSTQQKVASLRETLKQFGFKTNADRIEVQNRKTSPEKRKKKSRYQFVTPILLLRTEADREKLLSDKVGLILAGNVYENANFATFTSDNEVTSTYLQKYWRNDCKIFKWGISNDHEDFYVASLNIPKSRVKCGNLLKDWKKIPGRETSPVRQGYESNVRSPNYDCEYENSGDSPCKTASDVNKNQLSLDKPSTSGFKFYSDRSISPELFGSDDELPLENLQKSSQHNSESLLNLTPSKRSPSLQPKPSHGVITIDECSESLLNITPKKKESKGDRLKSFNRSASPSPSNSFQNKSLDLSGGDLFENEKGICIYESFTKENYHLTQHYFDLTNSDSEDNQSNNGSDEGDEMLIKSKTKSSDDLDVVMVDENDIVSPLKIGVASPLKTGVSAIMQGVLSLDEVDTMSDGAKTEQTECVASTSFASKTLDDEGLPIQNTSFNLSPNNSITSKNTGISESLEKANLTADLETTDKTNRRTKSLNITDYISNMLNDHQEFETQNIEFEPNKSSEFDNNEVFDLTQSSNGSTSSKQSISVVIKNRKERISTSSFDEISPTKSTTSDDVNLSQGSICISDEELNYSSAYSTPFNNHQRKTVAFKTAGIDLMKASCNYKVDEVDTDCMAIDANILNKPNEKRSLLQHPGKKSSPTKTKIRRSLFDERNKLDDSFNEVLENSRLFTNLEKSPTKLNPSRNKSESPPKSNSAENVQAEENCTTPKGEVIIKTTNVTPMADYDGMNTPKVAKELNKFGVKPMKRQRGIQMLKYIYESTHPVVGETMQRNNQVEEDKTVDEVDRVIKRRKVTKSPPKAEDQDMVSKKRKAVKSPGKRGRRTADVEYDVEGEVIAGEDKVNKKTKVRSPNKPKSPQTDDSDEFNIAYNMNYLKEQHAGFAVAKREQIEIVGNLMGQTETVEDLIFERTQSKKISSCRVPLHIAWHNLVSSLPELRKNILLYEPLQLEVVYMLLKEQGYKYNIHDLLTFLDKKCITIRTNQHSRGQTRQQKKKSPVKKS